MSDVDFNKFSQQSDALLDEFFDLNGLPSECLNKHCDFLMVLLSIIDENVPASERKFYKMLFRCVLDSILFYPKAHGTDTFVQRIEAYINFLERYYEELYDSVPESEDLFWTFYRYRVLSIKQFRIPKSAWDHFANKE